MYFTAVNTLSTVRDLLRFAVSRFNEAGLNYGHGTTCAYDEAAYLILASLHLPLDMLEPYLDARLLNEEIQHVVSQIEQRVEQRIPVAYLTQQAWQGEFCFYVDKRVIIPRSYIYELLGEALSPWIPCDEAIERALDLCTGSGCLAIQLAHHYPAAQIDAVDISLDALEVAAINVEQYGLADRIQLIHSDLFVGLEEKYQIIVTNPPYVNEVSLADLPSEYLHEPSIALGAGPDGLALIRDILHAAPDFLTDDGILLLEVGHNREALETAFPRLPFLWLATSAGDDFVCLLTREALLTGLAAH